MLRVATNPWPMKTARSGLCSTGDLQSSALRPELEARGHQYRTRSDTETILHLYEEDGERCVERLQGMFAFASGIDSGDASSLARDRLESSPLLRRYAGELLFGSEIKAILGPDHQGQPESRRCTRAPGYPLRRR